MVAALFFCSELCITHVCGQTRDLYVTCARQKQSRGETHFVKVRLITEQGRECGPAIAERIPLLRESPQFDYPLFVRQQFQQPARVMATHVSSQLPQTPRHKPPPGPRLVPVMAAGRPGPGVGNNMTDTRAKTILKEAVDAVVDSFAKHTHGYGRGT